MWYEEYFNCYILNYTKYILKCTFNSRAIRCSEQYNKMSKLFEFVLFINLSFTKSFEIKAFTNHNAWNA